MFTRTRCGTPAASRWQTRALTSAPSRIIWGIGIRDIRCGTRERLAIASRGYGIKALKKPSGTRIPVYEVAGLANSEGIEEARQTYSKLTKVRIELACFYATARPRRGRPKRASEVLAKRRPKSSRTISIAID
jgi:hypothetical protein